MVVLATLSPPERVAFVLHDMFELPFEDIAPLVERNPAAARQLASRARRRVKDAEVPRPDADLARQRDAVNAFFRAARGGDFEALVAVLDPAVALRTDFGAKRPPAVAPITRGAAAVAGQALMFANPNAVLIPALVNGEAGVVVTINGRPFAVMAFTVVAGRVVGIHALSDPERVTALAGPVLANR
jgi:RNA polymerase sigma-70 factor (ECF subfamily)